MVQHTHKVKRDATGSAATAASLVAALDLVNDGVLLLSPGLEIQAANIRASELLGHAQLSGERLDDMLPADAAARLRASAHLMVSASASKITLHFGANEGVSDTLEVTLHAAPERGSAALIALLRPVRNTATLTADGVSVEQDYLTGLPTRAALAARLQELESRSRPAGSQYAILFIDLDAFKLLNDERGHTAGDRVLTVVAERLQSAVRPGDLVARYGGDEFVIVVDEISAPQLARLARRLRVALAAPLEVAGQWLVTSASIGQALGDGTQPPAQVLEAADRGMYREKSARRKRRLR